jgi:hypothetical protein
MAVNRIFILGIACQLAGCVRVGFSEPADGGREWRGGGLLPDASDAPADAAADASDARADAAADALPDALPAGLNESCVARPCTAGLVCTGAAETRFCRPVCDGGGCADGQACGRPVVGGVTDPTVPRACITSGTADTFQSCKVLPCKKGLVCVKTDADAICFPFCVSDANCDTGQLCLPMTLSGVEICVPTCSATTICPETLKCVGAGPYPTDICVPVAPLGLYAICDQTHPCGPGMRCLGQLNQTPYCYKICPSPSVCATDEVCVTTDAANGYASCLRTCGLFDSPSKCGAQEVCVANFQLYETHCVPGPGDTTDCSTKPCLSGAICIDKVCKPACDATHPCPGIVALCLPVTFGGATTPWSACK